MTTASIGMWVLIALIVFVLILVKKSLVIIPQSETKIIERLGKYYATLKPGINVIIPFIDRPKTTVAYSNGRYFYTNTIDLREQVYDFDKQNVITKDNVQTQINALLYFQIVEPESAVYEINNLPNAIEKLTQTPCVTLSVNSNSTKHSPRATPSTPNYARCSTMPPTSGA